MNENKKNSPSNDRLESLRLPCEPEIPSLIDDEKAKRGRTRLTHLGVGKVELQRATRNRVPERLHGDSETRKLIQMNAKERTFGGTNSIGPN